MTEMTPEEERVRSYLVAQGEKRSPADIVDRVREAMRELFTAADAVPAARFAERPEPGEWSGNEVLAHVVDAARRVSAGITGILDGGVGGSMPEAVDKTPDAMDAAGWRAVLTAEREALFARVLAVAPNAHLDRTIAISSFGPLTWRSALLFMRAHDLDHAGQLRKIATAFA